MCGIIGVIRTTPNTFANDGKGITFRQTDQPSVNASYEVYKGMLTLQHRGEDACGITSHCEDTGIHQQKSLGLVTKSFSHEAISELAGNMAIGHNRYATIGGDNSRDIQPMSSSFPFGISMAHNGNIHNYIELKTKVAPKHHLNFLTGNDLEAILLLWGQILSRHAGEVFSLESARFATQKLMGILQGSYSVVGMLGNEGMFSFRDPFGIKPLVLGKKNNSYCITSETIALNFLEYEYVRDIKPGELVWITQTGEVHSFQCKTNQPAHCMFEYVYFAAAESQINNTSVYRARLELGKALGQKIKNLMDDKAISPEIVVPVPDTARTAAISISETLNLPYREGLIKNRYVQRSFILNSQDKREKAVELKLSPIRSEIEGKSILLIDDSIVRGTTSKKIINLLKKYGAKQIILGITCPPIRYGCFYGIDFPESDDLVANKKSIPEIAKDIGADHVFYLSIEELKKSLNGQGVCTGCLNQNYPTQIINQHEFINLRNKKEQPHELTRPLW